MATDDPTDPGEYADGAADADADAAGSEESPDDHDGNRPAPVERPENPPGKPPGMPTPAYQEQLSRFCDVRATLEDMDAVEDFEVTLNERATVRGRVELDPGYDFGPLNDLLMEHRDLRIEFLNADERTRELRCDGANGPRRVTGWTVRAVFSDADL